MKRIRGICKDCGKELTSTAERCLTHAGIARRGRVLTQEHIKKVRQAHIGTKRTDHTKANISNALRGKKLTDSTKEKLRIAAIGKKLSDEVKLKISKANTGKKRTPEMNRLQSIDRKGRVCLEETKRKMSIARKGKKLSRGARFNLMKKMSKHNIPIEWYLSFKDMEKFKHAHDMVYKIFKIDTESYKQTVEKIYKDKYFNGLYTKWLTTQNRWLKPSLDHIIPKNKGGKNEVDNLQVLTWFENMAKNDFMQSEWEIVKQDIINNRGGYFK